MWTRPDWVILGADAGDGRVTVIASDKLDEAELRSIFDYSRDVWPPTSMAHERRTTFELEVKMPTYVWVTGTTYEEALRTLFQRWGPKRTEHPEVPMQPGLPRPIP